MRGVVVFAHGSVLLPFGSWEPVPISICRLRRLRLRLRFEVSGFGGFAFWIFV
jgi:hypothetical protein